MDAPGSLSKLKWPLGVVLGLAAAIAVMPLLGGDKPKPQSTVGRTLSDCDGALHELVIQYTPGSADIVEAAYRDFLRQLPDAVTVHVVVRERADFDELARTVGATKCRLNPVVVTHDITCWARDRWLALHPAGESRAITVLSPQGEVGADSWPGRKGDEKVGESLSGAVADITAVRSELYFDGGDFVCDNETAFVTPNVRKRNLQVTVQTEAELIERLEQVLGLKVVLLKTELDHHAGMYMMTLGKRRVMVGDPRMTRALLTPEQAASLPLKGGPDFSDATAAKFDTVADQCRAAGYEVIRVPQAPGGDGRTYITYVNVILDERDGKRVTYMPNINGADVLNRAAAEVWQQAGYEVRPVNCTGCYTYFGSLRCLVSVLRRG
ncbi:MAG: hypothetical protein KF696_09205 [Planctomycetes bacterium]|nr:hypothetical protein [Planctomycetota bacterium]MCW8136764.1 hypothetical protein [Planctomycetota bacterium]